MLTYVRGSPMLRGERAILAGRTHHRSASRWTLVCGMPGGSAGCACNGYAAPHKSWSKKTGARMAPEQQRQEENGDAAALPHTYRNNRQHVFPRVRKIFRVCPISDCALTARLPRGALARPADVSQQQNGTASPLSRCCVAVFPACVPEGLNRPGAATSRAGTFPRGG